MRIAFILNSSGLYGANRSLLGLLEYLLEKEEKCFVIIPHSGEIEQELKNKGIEYAIMEYRACVWYPNYVGMPFLTNIVNLPKIVKTVRKWNVDIIHTNNSSHDIGIIVAKLLKKKHVWHIREIMEHNYGTRNIFPRLYKRLRAQSDAVICVSRFIYNYHMEHYPNANMRMIYNPYDIEYYDINRSEIMPDDTVTLLMAGSFTDYKRQIDSVEAIKHLVDRGIKNVKLVLAGDGVPAYKDKLGSFVQNNHLEDWIEFVGFTKDLREIRRKADISLCCSLDEALPRVVVEGMLGELLSIGANSGGIAELIEHQKTGLLYEVGNSIALAEQIEYAINHKAECKKMIVAAKKFAIQNFSKDQNSAQIFNIYRELLEK